MIGKERYPLNLARPIDYYFCACLRACVEKELTQKEHIEMMLFGLFGDEKDIFQLLRSSEVVNFFYRKGTEGAKFRKEGTRNSQ
jgi:hypothetical protein